MKSKMCILGLGLVLLAVLVGSVGYASEDLLVGKWVIDRSIGDTDGDQDIATLFYNADGSGVVHEQESNIEVNWVTEGDKIITTIPEYDVTFESRYSISPSGNVLTVLTEAQEGVQIQEVYYRFLNNHPDAFIGQWNPISESVNGEEMVSNRAAFVLENDGDGSHLWGVTEDRLILLDTETLKGQAWEYIFNPNDGGTVLIITEVNDHAITTVRLEKQ